MSLTLNWVKMLCFALCMCLVFSRLRRVTSGYWAIVQEFTHQAAVKEIKLLTKVVTDLGRSKYSVGNLGFVW